MVKPAWLDWRFRHRPAAIAGNFFLNWPAPNDSRSFLPASPRHSCLNSFPAPSARELRKIYRCHVLPIPTNRPEIRTGLPPQVFGTADVKWEAVVEEICQLHEEGRPVLVGTRSIDKSEIVGIIGEIDMVEYLAARS